MTIKDPDGMKLLAKLIIDELELYKSNDYPLITRASMIIFSRSLLIGSLKLLK